MVELARYLPGAYAGRELLRLGARVVRVEAPQQLASGIRAREVARELHDEDAGEWLHGRRLYTYAW